MLQLCRCFIMPTTEHTTLDISDFMSVHLRTTKGHGCVSCENLLYQLRVFFHLYRKQHEIFIYNHIDFSGVDEFKRLSIWGCALWLVTHPNMKHCMLDAIFNFDKPDKPTDTNNGSNYSACCLTIMQYESHVAAHICGCTHIMQCVLHGWPIYKLMRKTNN